MHRSRCAVPPGEQIQFRGKKNNKIIKIKVCNKESDTWARVKRTLLGRQGRQEGGSEAGTEFQLGIGVSPRDRETWMRLLGGCSAAVSKRDQ